MKFQIKYRYYAFKAYVFIFFKLRFFILQLYINKDRSKMEFIWNLFFLKEKKALVSTDSSRVTKK